MKKKLLLFCAALLPLLMLGGCAFKEAPVVDEPEDNTAEIYQANARLAELQAELTETRARTEAAREAAAYEEGQPAPVLVTCSGCLVNGEESYLLKVPGETVTLTALIPEGQVLDFWRFNGEPSEKGGESITLTPETSFFAEAVCCPERILKTEHAVIRFLNEENEPAGEAFTEINFQNEYFNAATKKYCEGGTVSAVITASVPRGCTLAYWLIDGVPYRFNRVVTEITVIDLDRAATYVPVFKKSGEAEPRPSEPKGPVEYPGMAVDPPSIIVY